MSRIFRNKRMSGAGRGSGGDAVPAFRDGAGLGRRIRNKRGQQIVEFGAAFSIFIAVVIPVLGLCLIPVRFFLAQMVLDQTVQRLAHSESRLDARNYLLQDRSWKELLDHCGVSLFDEKLSMLVGQLDQVGETQIADTAVFPKQLLPDSQKTIYTYTLSLEANCSVAPLLSGASGGAQGKGKSRHGGVRKDEDDAPSFSQIPGLNMPLVWHIGAKAAWENLSVDPYSAKYFLEE